MEITQEQYQLIADTFPKPRGNIKISNPRRPQRNPVHTRARQQNGGRYPNGSRTWHTVYMRFSRWAKSGVPTQVFQRLQQQQLIDPAVLGLDSTTAKVHPDGCGALTKRGPHAIGRSRGGVTTKIHMVAADARTAIIYALSPGQDHDGPHGRELLKAMRPRRRKRKANNYDSS